MLRAATDVDVVFIQSILNRADNLDKLEAYSDEALRTAIADEAMVVQIWEGEKGDPLGFCWLRKDDRGTKIEEFGVAKTGLGVGGKLFSAIREEFAAGKYPPPLWLAVAGDNTGAIRFYERHGFVAKETKPNVWQRRKGPPADALRMVLEVREPASGDRR